jgi:S-adenosyl methyltransferase
VYDYWLGGKDNFAADRAAAEQAIAAWPDIVLSVRANRAFLARVVRYLAGEAGIRQFLDIGTGIPASNNTHEVAQSVAPESRVVYVDNDHFKLGCTHQCAWRPGGRPQAFQAARVITLSRMGNRAFPESVDTLSEVILRTF